MRRIKKERGTKVVRISKIYATYRPVISFEIFPPRTEDRAEIVSRLAADFRKLGPAFISVTYGAGGTTRDTTVEIASLLSGFGFTVMSHLTGLGHTVKEIDEVLARLYAAGVENILALRGDPPRGASVFTAGDFAYAVDLIRYLRSKGIFGIAAAAYPEGHIESPRIDRDWHHLKEKVDAGTEFLVTQLFFDNRVFYHFLESIRRIGIFCPVTAGILPVLNADMVKRIISLCGASVPAKVLGLLDQYADDPASLEKAGLEYTTAQVADLIANDVDGVHLYTLNRTEWVAQLLNNIGYKRGEYLPTLQAGLSESELDPATTRTFLPGKAAYPANGL